MTGWLLRKNKGREWIGWAANAWAFFRYNAAQNFAGRAVVFIILAVAVFLGVVIFNLLKKATALGAEQVFDFLLIPAVLLTFYPAAFILQNDKDTGMIETLFGIPDHRYKVWLFRLFNLLVIVAAIVFLLAVFCRLGLAEFPLGKMVLQLMFPVVFLASLAFFVACLTGSGNSTAVIMVVTLLVFWALSGTLKESSWFLFHNPFVAAGDIRALVWSEITLSNRIYLSIGSVFFMMLALLRLQNRDKYI
jgi:hypothetical protein